MKSAEVPLNSCTLSPATALVPVRSTRTVGVVSLVLPPLVTIPVTGDTSSLTLVIEGAPGAVVSMVTVKFDEAALALPATSMTLALSV